MKPDELMIGDWVFYEDRRFSVPCKVVSIEQRRGVGENGYSFSVHEPKSNTLIFCIHLKPILLTAEFLKKNGWVKDDIFMTFSEDPNTELAWTDRCGACLYENGYHLCDCWHVHTLQNALRLCGIEKEIEL